MVRRLLTKPIWWWERSRSYKVRSRFCFLPPIAVERSSSRFVVLTTVKDLPDAMWSAWSWYRFLRREGFELQLAVDGELPEAEASAVRHLFPGISIYNVNELVQPLCRQWRNFGAFFNGHFCAKQVGLTLALSGEGPVLYSDHDVLAFQPPAELISCVHKGIPCYFADAGTRCHDPLIINESRTMGLGYIPDLNGGLLYVPRGAFPLELVDQLLMNWRPAEFCYFTPQTVQSVLMQHVNAQALPHDRYVISNQRQFYFENDLDYSTIAARHFTGTVRHVMYRYGIPEILRQANI